MKLKELFEDIDYKRSLFIDWEKQIEHICYNSHQVKRGDIFVAIKGFKEDGNTFIPQALKKGAEVIITENCLKADFPCIEVENARIALSRLSANYFFHPSRKLNVIGITGTNGKTTTSFLIDSIFKQVGKTGIVGTTGCFYDGVKKKSSITTPESLDIQRLFCEMLNRGIEYVSLEVSAHGITLYRLHDVDFKVKVFTNVSQDHLDFYKTLENYGNTKFSFFDEKTRVVVNTDDKLGKEIEKKTSAISYGFDKLCDIYPISFISDIHGIEASISTPKGEILIKSPLVGEYNLYNIMASIGVALWIDIDFSKIREGIFNLKGVSGRMERFSSNGVDFFVDYAHTPDALGNVLVVLEKLKRNRLIVVFGAGGDRDKVKRPKMGKVASLLSDVIILTSDNPRSEDPQAIIDGILIGIDNRKKVIVEKDRREAIRMAVNIAKKDDIVLIAGKGHETYQIVGKKKIPFDDRKELRKVLYD